LGAAAIPDPTTAGDFCRRFEGGHVDLLMDIINEARLKVWERQGPEFVEPTARIDADGSLVPTTGECKEGMALSYKGLWGYHPLLVSFANTREPLFIVNRSGNRPSYEGAAGYLDKAIGLCRRAGFIDILRLLLSPDPTRDRQLLALLLREAPDPNVTRPDRALAFLGAGGRAMA